jgi:putative membrane protein
VTGLATRRDAEESHRLHPLTPLARSWQIIALAIAFVAQEMAAGFRSSEIWLALVAAVPIALSYGFVSWWFTHYRIEAGDLYVETGVLFRRSRRVHLARLQAVDVVRPLIARLLGLAELRLEVAGGDKTEAPLAYLSEPAADRLRAELLARAAGIAPDAPEAPENVLVKVPHGALVASIALSGTTIIGTLLTVGLLVIGVGLEQPGVLIPLLPIMLAFGGATFRTFSHGFDFTLAESPDGLRLRHGLLEHRSQTVPPGRVQAIRLVQPLLWRTRGWVRVDVNIAGYSGGRVGEGGAAVTSVLLPVAPRRLALDVISRLLPGVEVDSIPFAVGPRRMIWVRPITWRSIGYGVTDTVFVAKRGVLRREIDIIAHGKTQSVRLTQGPLQRKLRLATVHIDTTPGPVRVHVPDWDAADAIRIVDGQSRRARAGRRAAAPDRWMTPHREP